MSDDLALLERVAAGDRQSFDALWDASAGTIRLRIEERLKPGVASDVLTGAKEAAWGRLTGMDLLRLIQAERARRSRSTSTSR